MIRRKPVILRLYFRSGAEKTVGYEAYQVRQVCESLP
jgi:hypothetical protein